MFFKRSIFAVVPPLLLMGLLLTACGNSTTTSGNGTTPTAAPTATTAPTTAPTMLATATPATGGSSAIVKTASATVQGKTVTILTNAQGLTLYYKKDDTATSVTCTGGCASAWPPLLYNGSGKPSSSPTLPHALTVFTSGPNGPQVEYDGHPLYTFVSDTAPGQTTGEGVGGVWHVATTSL